MRPISAPRRWSLATSSGITSTRSCCSGSRVTGEAARPAQGGAGGESGYLPARVKLAGSAAGGGRSGGEQARVRRARRASGPRSRPRRSGSDGLPPPRAVMPRRSRITSGRSASFRSWAPPITAWLARTARLGRLADAERALEQHAPLRSHAGRRSRIPSSRRFRGFAMMRGRRCSAASRWPPAGDVDAAIAAHEAALARDPSLVQAHANLLALYGRARNWPKAEAHYRAALDAGSANGRRVLRLRRSCSRCRRSGRPRRRRISRRSPSTRLHANARNNLGQLLERERDVEGALAQYRAGGRRTADVQARPVQPRPHAPRPGPAGRGDRGVRDAAAAGRRRDAALPVRACRRPTSGPDGSPTASSWASEARRLALEFGQTDFAAAIAAELAKLK